jgi:hypothetical protein
MKITHVSIALALAGFAIPVLAGNSWPQGPSSPATKATSAAAAPSPVRTSSTAAPGNFTYRCDGIGWEITPHKYVFSGGRLVHSDECDHTMRTAEAVTPAVIEAGRKLWPGG